MTKDEFVQKYLSCKSEAEKADFIFEMIDQMKWDAIKYTPPYVPHHPQGW